MGASLTAPPDPLTRSLDHPRRVCVRTIVKGKNAEVPDRVREYAERKLRRIERLLDDQTDATVELWSEHHKSAADTHIAEVTLVIHGQRPAQPRDRRRPTRPPSTTSSTRSNARRSITRRSRACGLGRRRRSRSSAASPTAPRVRAANRRIVKTKRFAIEPMFEEDAVAAMEELGHRFFVFVNAETERVAILYRRDDGDYGLIEPVVGGDYTQGRSHAPSAPERAAYGSPLGVSAVRGEVGPLARRTMPRMLPDGRRLGAHLPLGDGMVKAVDRAHEIGAERAPDLRRQPDRVAPSQPSRRRSCRRSATACASTTSGRSPSTPRTW